MRQVQINVVELPLARPFATLARCAYRRDGYPRHA